MVDDIQEIDKSQRVEDINVELEKARKRMVERVEKTRQKKEADKRILERVEKIRQEREAETNIQGNSGIIDKENQMHGQYDSYSTSLNVSSVSSPFMSKCY